jgi:hypothetical protein
VASASPVTLSSAGLKRDLTHLPNFQLSSLWHLDDAGVPSRRFVCQWYQPGDTSLGRRRIALNLFGPIGGLTPADRFANEKAPATVSPRWLRPYRKPRGPEVCQHDRQISVAPPYDEIYLFSSPTCFLQRCW